MLIQRQSVDKELKERVSFHPSDDLRPFGGHKIKTAAAKVPSNKIITKKGMTTCLQDMKTGYGVKTNTDEELEVVQVRHVRLTVGIYNMCEWIYGF